jgi:CHAT domain-containing protein
LATLYHKMENYAKAEELHLQALDIRAKVLGKNHPHYSTSLNNLGMLYYMTKNYIKAEKLLLEAIEVDSKIYGEEHPSFATHLNSLAFIYKDIGNYKKSEELFLRVENVFEKILGKEHPNYALSLNNLARMYLTIGKLDTALFYCLESFNANSSEINGGFDNVETLDKYTYYSNEKTNNSIESLLEILLAQYNQTKDKSTLEKYYQVTQAAMRFNESIRNNFSGESDKLKNLSTNNIFVLQGIEAALMLKKNGYEQEAFRFAELNKGVLLMDAAKKERAFSFGDLPDSLIREEQKLQKKLSKLKASLLEDPSKKIQDSLIIVLNKTNQEIDAFSKNIKIKYPKYAAINYENKSATAKQIQALLDDKTALLEYVVGDSAVYIFYLDKKNIKLFEIPLITSLLSNKIKDFHGLLSNYKLLATTPDDSYKKYTSTAYWFYENLIAEALSNAKHIQNLVIVADGELGHLPFETFLVAPAPQGKTDYSNLHYLLNDFSISYNYSATLWKENKEAPKVKNNGQILGFASNYDIPLDSFMKEIRLPTYQNLRALLNPLPAARKEVELLAQNFNGFFAFDTLASEKKFKEKSGDYAIIHLAMHGLLDNNRPILSSLVFTEVSDSLENNFLQAYEISKLKLNADLVILSACETGYGKFETGNGIASLARAFMYAGAPALVVSLWQVNDESTGKLMQLFYENLAKGLPKDEALRKAKLKYIAEAKNPMAAHPAFWSPFILIGDNAPVKIQRKGNYLPWLIGGGVLVLVFGGLFLRKKIKAAA